MTDLDLEGLLYGLFAGDLIWEPPNGIKSAQWQRDIQNSGDSIRRLPCRVPLTDEEHLSIDMAYSSLKPINASAHTVIRLKYRDLWPDSKIAKEGVFPGGRLTTDGVRAIRETGELWLADRLGVPVKGD